MTEGHALDFGLGEGSPLARLYQLEAWVLLLGVGHDSNTSLHLAEFAPPTQSPNCPSRAPLLIDNQRVWLTMQDIDLTPMISLASAPISSEPPGWRAVHAWERRKQC